jgi:anti-sigma factor RsiW
MNCKNAELQMMKHFEKTIVPQDAQALAKHILTCETCRELYLTFDEAMDCEITHTREDFTAAVMERVRGVGEKRASAPATPIWWRLVAAFNMLLFAAGFIWLDSAGEIFAGVSERIAAVGAAFSAESIGTTSLLLVALTGALLFVLHNGETETIGT